MKAKEIKKKAVKAAKTKAKEVKKVRVVDSKEAKGKKLNMATDFEKAKKGSKEYKVCKAYNIEAWNVGEDIKLYSKYPLEIAAANLIKKKVSESKYEPRPYFYWVKAGTTTLTIA